MKSFKVTGNWEEASLDLPTSDSARREAAGELPVAHDAGISRVMRKMWRDVSLLYLGEARGLNSLN